MNFAAPLALVTVIARARTALTRGLQRAAIQDDRAGLALPLLRHAQHRAQIVDHRLEATRVEPALRLLIDHLPRRESEFRRVKLPERLTPRIAFE